MLCSSSSTLNVRMKLWWFSPSSGWTTKLTEVSGCHGFCILSHAKHLYSLAFDLLMCVGICFLNSSRSANRKWTKHSKRAAAEIPGPETIWQSIQTWSTIGNVLVWREKLVSQTTLNAVGCLTWQCFTSNHIQSSCTSNNFIVQRYVWNLSYCPNMATLATSLPKQKITNNWLSVQV